MDLSTVWKLRASEGCPQHFWATCTDAQQWTALFNLNLSSSGLVSLPTAIGQLASLHVLRLNHNKLTSLPQELGQLSELEVLSVNHNQLTTLPGEVLSQATEASLLLRDCAHPLCNFPPDRLPLVRPPSCS
jgi:Leucine-rich repeat (LRR) protein